MADNHALELEVRINTAPNIASLESEIDALSKSLASHPLVLATTIDPKAQQDQAKKALDAIGAQEIRVKLKEDGTPGSGKSKFVDDYTVQHKKRIHEIIEVYKELDAEEEHNHRAALNRTKERTAEIGRLRAEQRLNIAAAKEQERVESKLWSTAKIDGYNRQIDAVQNNMVSLLDAQKNISSSGVIPTEFRQFDTLINEAYHSFTQLETALRAVNQSSGDDRVRAQKAFNDQLKFTEKALKAVEAESRKVNTQITAMQKKVNGASGYEKRLAGISSAYNGNTAQIEGYDDIAGQIRDLKGIGTVDLSNYTAAKALIEQIERKLNDAAIRASEFRSAMRIENKTTGLQNVIDHLEIYRNRLEVVRSSANKLVGGIPEELSNAMGSAETLISDLENIGDVDDGNVENVSAKFRKLGVAMRSVAAEMAKLRTHTSGNIGMEQREREINRMRVALETLYNSQSRLRNDPVVTSQFEGLMSRLNLGSIDSDEKLAAAKKEFDAITKSQNENGKAADSLGGKIGKMYAKFGGWSLITMSMTKAIQTIKAMISNVIELDTAMTELRKVTDETNTTYNRFLNGASKTAKSIGASLKDVVSATADFARLGYTLEDSAVLAKSAQVYLNVGDDLDGIDSATSSLISTIKAFGIEAADVMGIVDQFNEVSNNFAISSGGIGEALLRSASALSTANNSLAESIALITAGNTTVQNPEHIGEMCA